MSNLPFEDNTDVEQKLNSNIKLDNSKSRFAKKPEEQRHSKDDFQNKINEHQNKEIEIKEKIASLSTQFVSFIKDQTLAENKSPIKLDLEKDISRQLVNLCLELNNDDTQPEGIGSAGMIMLLLRTTLIQRDIINNISHELDQIKQKLI